MSLLTDLWATDGYYAIVRINPEWPAPSHRWFDDPADAEAFALRGPNGKGHGRDTNVYFACSVYDDAESRTQQHVTSVGAFWLDIDVAKKPEQPQTKKEALAAVKRLCEVKQIPQPWYIVDSGTGLHVYWRTTPKDRVTWTRQAHTLAQWCTDAGLEEDDSRTHDAASILRIPGTKHTKSGREVKVVWHNPDAECLELPEAKVRVFEKSEWDTDEVGHANADRIIAGCAQLREVIDCGGDVVEPLRYATLQLLRHTDWSDTREYAEVFHAVNHFDPHEEVERKMAQLEKRAVGPSTCAKFDQLNPGGCAGCPLAGKITSPIQLDRILPAPDPEPSEDFEYAEGEVPQIVHPNRVGLFNINDHGVTFVPVDDEDAGPEQILFTPLRISYLGRVVATGAIAMLEWVSLRGVKHEAEMPMIALADKREMARVLLKNLIPYAPGKEALIMRYLAQYAAEIQQQAEPEVIARHFGWVDESTFVVGDEAISENGSTKTRLTTTVSPQIVGAMVPKGDLKKWVATTEHYQWANLRPQGFAMLCALAAPLLKRMNVQGAVLSLAGPSGTGKTTVIRHAMSVYGQPSSLLLSGRPTITAQIDMMRTACNLAVGMDDVTLARMRELTDMVYMAANGQSRERAGRDGTMRERDTWSTVLMISTNSQLLKMPEIVSEAERRRIVELNVLNANRMNREIGQDINDTIADNYGVMGREYLRLLIRNQDKVLAIADNYKQEMWDGIADEYRFGVWLCAAAMAGGLLAYKKGLIAFDPRPCVQYALESLKRDAADELTPVEVIDQMVRDYIRDNVGSFTSKRERKFDFTDLTNRKVAGTINHDKQMIFIPSKKLEKHIRSEGGSMISYQQWKSENQVVSSRELLIPSTKGGKNEPCIGIPHNTEGDDDE